MILSLEVQEQTKFSFLQDHILFTDNKVNTVKLSLLILQVRPCFNRSNRRIYLLVVQVDDLTGGNADDIITGGAGNDTLVGGIGNDTLM